MSEFESSIFTATTSEPTSNDTSSEAPVSVSTPGQAEATTPCRSCAKALPLDAVSCPACGCPITALATPSAWLSDQRSERGPRLAAPWQRIAACLIDATIIGCVLWLLGLVVSHIARGVVAGQSFLINDAALVIYMTTFLTRDGWTPGMRLLRIRVIGEDGSPLSQGRAALRSVMYLVSLGVLFLGVLAISKDPRGQGWHDKVAHTLVVPA